MPHLLRSRVKNYEWGAVGALSQFLGLPSSNEPEAEVWFGDHPLSECSVVTQEGLENFSTWLRKADTTFPLLVKILAAEKPLSIQVHPNEEQARRGFLREEEAGVPLNAPERTYKDQSAKPELLIALSSDFVALVGFAPEWLVIDRIDRWVEMGAPVALQEIFKPIASLPRESSRQILSSDEGVSRVVSDLGTWIGSRNFALPTDTPSPDLEILRAIHDAHPGDPGILFALVMNHVFLQRGEAIFVNAGEVHAYLGGTGLEVMLPSDNVIRAGLTHKHKDEEAFLELAVFEPTEDSSLIPPESTESGARYQDFGAAFSVTLVDAGSSSVDIERLSICVVETGHVAFGSPTASLEARAGEVLVALPGEKILVHSHDSAVWVVHSDTH